MCVWGGGCVCVHRWTLTPIRVYMLSVKSRTSQGAERDGSPEPSEECSLTFAGLWFSKTGET